MNISAACSLYIRKITLAYWAINYVKTEWDLYVEKFSVMAAMHILCRSDVLVVRVRKELT